MSPAIVSASAILAGLPPAEVAESRLLDRLELAHRNAEVVRVTYDRTGTWHLLDAMAARANAAAIRELDDRLERSSHLARLDRRLFRCPQDGAWVMAPKRCRCCAARERRAG